jgi:hypothetical protein
MERSVKLAAVASGWRKQTSGLLGSRMTASQRLRSDGDGRPVHGITCMQSLSNTDV